MSQYQQHRSFKCFTCTLKQVAPIAFDLIKKFSLESVNVQEKGRLNKQVRKNERKQSQGQGRGKLQVKLRGEGRERMQARSKLGTRENAKSRLGKRGRSRI